jgi:hypothetical protein
MGRTPRGVSRFIRRTYSVGHHVGSAVQTDRAIAGAFLILGPHGGPYPSQSLIIDRVPFVPPIVPDWGGKIHV